MKTCRFRQTGPASMTCERCGRFVKRLGHVQAACRNPRIEGLGDVLEIVLRWLGIARVVKAVKPNCGCDKRQRRWNRWWPF
jgi:hypothetical protein